MTYDFLLNGTQPSHSVITQQEAGLNLLGSWVFLFACLRGFSSFFLQSKDT